MIPILLVSLFLNPYFRNNISIEDQFINYSRIVKQFTYDIRLHESWITTYELERDYVLNKELSIYKKTILPNWNDSLSTDHNFCIQQFKESISYFQSQKYKVNNYINLLVVIRVQYSQIEIDKYYNNWKKEKFDITEITDSLKTKPKKPNIYLDY